MSTKNILLILGVLVIALGWFISSDQRRVTHHVRAGAQVWHCPMHPWIKSDKPGVCPICGMALVLDQLRHRILTMEIPGHVPVEISSQKQKLAGIRTALIGRDNVIPKDAVMDTGVRKIVFVENNDGEFEPKEIHTDKEIENGYEIKSGLKTGDRLAVSGIFLLDSESQIQASLEEDNSHV